MAEGGPISIIYRVFAFTRVRANGLLWKVRHLWPPMLGIALLSGGEVGPDFAPAAQRDGVGVLVCEAMLADAGNKGTRAFNEGHVDGEGAKLLGSGECRVAVEAERGLIAPGGFDVERVHWRPFNPLRRQR